MNRQDMLHSLDTVIIVVAIIVWMLAGFGAAQLMPTPPWDETYPCEDVRPRGC
jgi:hypothetical protein